MDWLGGFSSIKGQIGNLTKDLLSDDSNEIEDPKAQLQVCKGRITELEQLVEAQKCEINTLRSENDDFRVHLESSQLRLDHFKEEFKKELNEKDEIIANLRSEMSSERGEPEGKTEIVFNVFDVQQDVTSDSSLLHSNNGTATWEELRDEVMQLRTELTKWKRIAKKKQSKQSDDTCTTSFNYELEKTIEKLKQDLVKSDELRQTELTAIQENHTENLSNLMDELKHKETDIFELRRQLDELKLQTVSVPNVVADFNDAKAEDNKEMVHNCTSSSSLPFSLKKSRSTKKKKKKQGVGMTSSCIDVLDKHEGLSLLEAVTQTSETSLNPIKSILIEDKLVSTDLLQVCDAFSQTVNVDQLTCASQTDYHSEMKDAITEYDLSQSSSISVQTQSSSHHSSCLEIRLDLPSNQNSPQSVESHHSDASSTSSLSSSLAYQPRLDGFLDRLDRDVHAYTKSVDALVHALVVSPQDEPIRTGDVDGLVNNAFRLQQRLKSKVAKIRSVRMKQKVDSHGEQQHPTLQLEQDETLHDRQPTNDNFQPPKSDSSQLDESSNEMVNVSFTDHWQYDEDDEWNSNDSNGSKVAPNQSDDGVATCGEDVGQQQIREHVEFESKEPLIHLSSTTLCQRDSPKLTDTANQEVELEAVVVPAEPVLDNVCSDGQSKAAASERRDELKDDDEEEDSVVVDELNALAFKLYSCLLEYHPIEMEWNADRWDFVLYSVLKNYLLSTDESISDDRDNRIIELSAELSSLKDLLYRHDQFRSQAEHDLKHLLATIHKQQGLIETLTATKRELEDQLCQRCSPTDDGRSGNDRDDSDDFVLQLLVYLQSVAKEHLSIVNDECQRLDRSTNAQSIDERYMACVELVDWFVSVFVETRTALSQYQSNFSNLWTSLQQKHAESQGYHDQLQKVLNDLADVRRDKEECEFQLESLRNEMESSQKIQNIETAQVSQSVSFDVAAVGHVQRDDASHCDTAQSDNEHKLMTELKRLQAHLIEVEESYTNEALQAENREVQLRARLTELESQIEHLDQFKGSIGDCLQQARTDRDDSLRRLAESENEIYTLKESLINLQNVLDSFQRDQNLAIRIETDRLRLDLNRSVQQLTSAQDEISRLNKQLEGSLELERQVASLQAQNQHANDHIGRLQNKVKQREIETEQVRSRVAQMALDTDSRIDKTLIKNLLISYFLLPTNQRDKGIKVIGSLLEFTDDEYLKIGTDSGTIPKLMGWVKSVVSNLPTGPPKDVLSHEYPNKTFSELLLAFLEEESSPRSPIKLPMEYYTPDSVRLSTVKRQTIETYPDSNKSSSTSTTSNSRTSLSYLPDDLPDKNFYLM